MLKTGENVILFQAKIFSLSESPIAQAKEKFDSNKNSQNFTLLFVRILAQASIFSLSENSCSLSENL